MELQHILILSTFFLVTCINKTQTLWHISALLKDMLKYFCHCLRFFLFFFQASSDQLNGHNTVSSARASRIVSLAADPRVTGVLPVGRLKKRLLAACRNLLDCGLESLLCPFFHRLSFDPVPDRSFPDLTIFGGEKVHFSQNYLVEQPAPDDSVAQQMTSRMFSHVTSLRGDLSICQQMAQFSFFFFF